MDWLADPLHYQFVRNALVVCVVAGGLCGLLGVYVTLRGMSYIGHGLSHAIFGGAAVCAVLGLNFFVGAGVWGLASGVAIGRISRKRAIGTDAAIGVITTAGFALGIVLLGRYTRVRQSIEATLFGSVLGVTVQDMVVIVAVTAATVLVVVAWYRPLLFTTFDAEVAEATGVRVGLVDALLMLLVCGAILKSMRVLGVTLIAAALVIPPVTARLLTSSFNRMLGLSTALGAAGGGVGMYLSYHLDVSSGATIVLVDFAAFAVVYAATTPRRARRGKLEARGPNGVTSAPEFGTTHGRRWDPAPAVRLNDGHGEAGAKGSAHAVGARGGDGARGDVGDRAGRDAST